MARETRIQVVTLAQDDIFIFPFCAVREFAISPANGTEGASWTVSWYGKQVTYENVAISFGGKNDSVYSCPTDGEPGELIDPATIDFNANPVNYIAVKGVSGTTVIHYIN